MSFSLGCKFRRKKPDHQSTNYRYDRQSNGNPENTNKETDLPQKLKQINHNLNQITKPNRS